MKRKRKTLEPRDREFLTNRDLAFKQYSCFYPNPLLQSFPWPDTPNLIGLVNFVPSRRRALGNEYNVCVPIVPGFDSF
jgi:hypothetical protein